MNVVIAIDSLKGSLSSMEAGEAAKEGILRVMDADVIIKPVADGGEGTVEALMQGLSGKIVSVDVEGPMGIPVTARYGYMAAEKLAVIEMAAAAGLTLVKTDMKNPMKASTYGVGEMIIDAIEKGCRHFLIGIGGSATNDGGVGMLTALGYQFLDSEGNVVSHHAEGLSHIAAIEAAKDERLKECTFKVACDVNNPLCGTNGATYIYGPQKGVSKAQQPILDQALAHFAKQSQVFTGMDKQAYPGAGAAGGLGFAFLSYLDAQLLPGIELVMEIVELEEAIRNADLVITGEGRLDEQSAMGKAPVGVAQMAKKYGKPVIAVSGVIGNGAELCNEKGIDAFFPILRQITTAEEAMNKINAHKNMADTVEQIFRLLKQMKIDKDGWNN